MIGEGKGKGGIGEGGRRGRKEEGKRRNGVIGGKGREGNIAPSSYTFLLLLLHIPVLITFPSMLLIKMIRFPSVCYYRCYSSSSSSSSNSSSCSIIIDKLLLLFMTFIPFLAAIKNK